MKAVVYQDVKRVRFTDVADPEIRDPEDAIVQITTSAICGSDLHFYHGKAPLDAGDSMGHEGMGIVESVGPGVTRFRAGDRVVMSFDIACGRCWFCKRGQTSLCDEFRVLGIGAFGGDLGGTQAERVRVPFADVNLLPVPGDIDDQRALLVGDVLTTGYYGAAISDIRPGDTVAVVGAGPVGFFAVQAAALFGAGEVLALDQDADRLTVAQKIGATAINVTERNPQMAVGELTGGRGADVVIEAVGSEPAFETSVDVVRGGGTICVVGMYVSERLSVPLGFYWARGLRLQFAGICPVHAWWERSMDAVRTGTIDPLPIISHVLPLSDAAHAYELFDTRQATKVLLKP